MYLVYFKTIEDNHRCLYNDDHFETLEYLPDTKDCYHYEVFKGYDATDDGLSKFKSDMIKCGYDRQYLYVFVKPS
jgi:hypothetical protein